MKMLPILCVMLLLPGCAMPRWGNKEITFYDHEAKVFRVFMPADGKVRYKSGKDGVEVEIDNRGAESLPEGLARAAAYGLTGNAATAVIAK